MRRFFKVLIGVLLLGAIMFYLGPRPETVDGVTFDPSSIGGDVETYLSNSETNIPNLTPGAEKEIVWRNPATKEKTNYSIVYVHGFSATKHEIRPVPDRVAEAIGANLYYTRITGHGRDGAGLADATVQDHANDYAEAVEIGRRVGEKVILVATSNGANISTWGLGQTALSSDVVAAVFLSANYELQGISTSLANIPWAETILPILGGEHREWEPSNELHGKWWTTSYPSKAIFPMTAMLKMLKDVDKSSITQPAFFIFSPDDTVIVPDEIRKVAGEWGGPAEIYEIETTEDASKHVIAGDIMSPGNTDNVTNRIIEWLKKTLP
ncbi:MAG: alpha/beta hydrolase [Rhizobiaceae bacterium]|nr:alpha/beta hydrolase [Rhizobiaceae bacterium]